MRTAPLSFGCGLMIFGVSIIRLVCRWFNLILGLGLMCLSHFSYAEIGAMSVVESSSARIQSPESSNFGRWHSSESVATRLFPSGESAESGIDRRPKYVLSDIYHESAVLQLGNSLSGTATAAQQTRSLHQALPEHYQPLAPAFSQNLAPLLANIILNNNSLTDAPILIYTNEQTACFSDDQLIDLKIINSSGIFYEYFQTNPDSLHQNSLKCAVNESQGVTFKVDSSVGTLTIRMPVSNLKAQNINLGLNNEAIYPTNPAISNSTAYQLSYTQTTNSGQGSMSGLGNFVNTTSTPFGSLIAGVSSGNQNPTTRQYTYWQTDFPAPMTSAVIGDATQMIGSWGIAYNYTGVQYGSNLLLRPGYFFTATPIISGSVNAPSTAEILLNGGPVKNTDIASGQFNLYNLPILNGDGTVTVNLKDPNGTTYQSVNLPYYTSPKVLQDTTYLYQYNLGVPRGNSGPGWNLNYASSTPGLSTQHFIGITNQYTMELHAEMQPNNFANLGMAHNMNWFNAFSTSLTTAVSNSESAPGVLFGFNLSRQTTLPNSVGFGYNITSQSQYFQMLGQPVSGSQIAQTVFVNYLSPFGLSIAGGYSNINSASLGITEVYNATLSWQFLRNFLLTSTTYVSNSVSGQTIGTNLGLNIVLDAQQSVSSNISSSQAAGISSSLSTLDYQYLSASNLWGGNLIGGYATGGSGNATPTSLGANGYYLFKNFNLNAQAAYNDSNNYSYGGSVAGNVVLSRAGVNLGQYSTLSFIVVRVGHLANIGIKQNGSIIGKTDRNGSFVLPNITPYLSQDIEVNALDLPFNTELDSYAKRVVAPLNGGTVVTFTPVSFVPAFALLRFLDQQIPPTGYSAELYNEDGHKLIETDYIVDNGQIQLSKYSPDLNYVLEFKVKEGSFSCPLTKANIQADSNQYLYNLGTLQCSKIK